MNPLLFPPSRLARSVLHSESDERLAALAQAGSGAAFEAIVARHRHGLVRLCARIVGDTDAEEAVQNAIISAHLALARGDRVQNLGPWLRAIAHNASLNILRARAARPEYPDDGLQLAEPHDDPTDRREQLGELVAAVQALPQRQRHAIVMRELEGRSYDEIADRLGSTNGAVRQLLNRARAAIRDRLSVLPGLEPLTRWLSGGSVGSGVGATARIGALAGGCGVGAKLCASALVPAVIAGGAGGGLVPRIDTTPRPKRTAPRHATPTATVIARRQATVSRPVVRAATPVRATVTPTRPEVVRVSTAARPTPRLTIRATVPKRRRPSAPRQSQPEPAESQPDPQPARQPQLSGSNPPPGGQSPQVRSPDPR